MSYLYNMHLPTHFVKASGGGGLFKFIISYYPQLVPTGTSLGYLSNSLDDRHVFWMYQFLSIG